MTEKTPQEQALLDASAVLQRTIKACHGDLDCSAVAGAIEDHARADEAYRAAQVPKECRPPEVAKAQSLWWLTRGSDRCVSEWDGEDWWDIGSSCAHSPKAIGAQGWTVYGPCIFPGTGMAAAGIPVSHLQVALLSKKHGEVANISLYDLTQYTEAALRHFAPKLREISDEKIRDLWHSFESRAAHGEPGYLTFARAIISYVAEGEK